MESRFKLRISRMFRSSFGSSCRSKDLSDVIGQPVFVAQENHQDFESCSQKKQIIPSICKPKLSEVVKLQQKGDSESVAKDALFRRKVSDGGLYFVSGGKEGRTCPPASPISPMNALFKLHEKEMKDRKKTATKKTKKPLHYSNNGWFSSEDDTEDETETFFSSRSLSSDSSSSLARRRRNQRSSRRRRATKKKIVPELGFCPLVSKDMVEESVAIVKRSTNPYDDFRTSMVEMIIEKQIFSAKDLEKLLQCFLSLNSPHHHRIIVEVFTEVWEALFSLT
ncbi:hypothetical protein ACHQM5_002233 [Ranunculus cassubicifolius]